MSSVLPAIQLSRYRRTPRDSAHARLGLTPDLPALPGASSLWMVAPGGTASTALAQRIRQDSVPIEPGAPFFAGRDASSDRIRLAVTSIREAAIDEGIARIAAALA